LWNDLFVSFFSSPPSSQVSAWVTALATVALAAVAVPTFLVGYFTFRRQVKAYLRTQAERIILEGKRNGDREFFVVQNMSTLPIRALYGEVRIFRGFKIAPIGKMPLSFDNRIVAPNETVHANLPPSRGNLHTVSITFQDSAGVVWKRNWPNGVLRIEIRRPSAGSIAGGIFALIVLAEAASISYTMFTKGPTAIHVLETIALFVVGIFVGLLVVILGIFGNRESIPPPPSERRIPTESSQSRTKLPTVVFAIVMFYALRARRHRSS
jgi:hypothetical protein